MENMTKEQTAFDYSGWSRDALIYHIITLENKLASGSVAAPKEDEENETLEELARIWIDGLTPGFTNNSLNKLRLADDIITYVNQELASLRQQLKEREESIKELYPFAERWHDTLEWGGDNPSGLKVINEAISRAKALLDKQ